jgi:hypothetical protein
VDEILRTDRAEYAAAKHSDDADRAENFANEDCIVVFDTKERLAATAAYTQAASKNLRPAEYLAEVSQPLA